MDTTFSALLRGIQHSVASTHAMLTEQYAQLFEQFFEEEETTGAFKPKMIYIQPDENRWIPVPLISLVNPRGYFLEKFKVQLSVEIDEVYEKQSLHGEDIDRASFNVRLANQDSKTDTVNVAHLDMEFASGDTPEALKKVLETLADAVAPYTDMAVLNHYPTADLGRKKSASRLFTAIDDEADEDEHFYLDTEDETRTGFGHHPTKRKTSPEMYASEDDEEYHDDSGFLDEESLSSPPKPKKKRKIVRSQKEQTKKEQGGFSKKPPVPPAKPKSSRKPRKQDEID